ncbi:MAG: M15 family metallopeptidase [Deltaproteobacteria bacterium]|nr:M15 family metallopeptidase [Deltaproteobacteria bacterium]
MSIAITPLAGEVTTGARLNIRGGAPSINAPIDRKVDAGTTLLVRGIAQGDRVSGNADWYAGAGDTYFWSGACSAFRPGSDGAAPLATVHRRPNGTLQALSDGEIRRVFGDIRHSEASKRGAVTLEASWVADNITALEVDLLAPTGFATIRVHRKAAESFRRVFDAIRAAGLAERIITCAGTFVPRHKGWDPTRTLSPHSWGIAIDLNAEWNGYGAAPAALGAHGSLRELVPLFEAAGFAWGGYFTPDRFRDGMHFELARLDL